MRILCRPNASRWTKTRVKAYGPFEREEQVVFPHDAILVRGTTPKPNGERWCGWLNLDEIEIVEEQ